MSLLPAVWQQWCHAELAQRDAAHLRRQPRYHSSPQSSTLMLDGRRLDNFCSNDYLGLANDDELKAAMMEAVSRLGVGAGSAGLVCGYHEEHQALAAELAEWLGVESVLLFGNGYLANLGVLQGLLGRGDVIVQDKLNHASLIDGGLASGAQHQRYRHADAAAAEQKLAASTATRKLVVSDGVFSMDGDVAPVVDLVAVAERQQALLVLDEAHAFGVLGEQGRGSVAAAGLSAHTVPLRIGTLGKAFGVYGAFVAGPTVLIDTLQQRARTAIYTTALPAAIAAVTRVALQRVRHDDWRRERLQRLVARLRTGLLAQGWRLADSQTPIQPVLIGDADRANQLSAALLAHGVWVSSIRPPTVPAGQARLRFTVTAGHDDAAIDRVLAAMQHLSSHYVNES